MSVAVRGLDPGAAYTLRHERVDDTHSNVAAAWGRLRAEGQDWPTDEQWVELRQADRLEELDPVRTMKADEAGSLVVDIELPMPAMSLLTLQPG